LKRPQYRRRYFARILRAACSLVAIAPKGADVASGVDRFAGEVEGLFDGIAEAALRV